jgi:hypothetical protein
MAGMASRSAATSSRSSRAQIRVRVGGGEHERQLIGVGEQDLLSRPASIAPPDGARRRAQARLDALDQPFTGGEHAHLDPVAGRHDVAGTPGTRQPPAQLAAQQSFFGVDVEETRLGPQDQPGDEMRIGARDIRAHGIACSEISGSGVGARHAVPLRKSS